MPLKVSLTPVTITESPTIKGWAADVVNVATFEVNDLFVTEAKSISSILNA